MTTQLRCTVFGPLDAGSQARWPPEPLGRHVELDDGDRVPFSALLSIGAPL